MRVKARRGVKVGIVALARKVLCILYHLLMKQELYKDELLSKPRNIKHISVHPANSMNIDEMIDVIVKAGYEVRRNEFLDSG